MVEDIESFGAELQLQVFADGELPPNRHVHLPRAKEPQKIARSLSLIRRRRKGVGVNANPPGAALIRPKRPSSLHNRIAISPVDEDGHSWNKVESVVEVLAGYRIKIAKSDQVDRKCRSCRKPVIKAPIMQ